MAASLSSALCTLADRSAATSSDCWLGVVWTWKPASEAVSSSTISVRSPRDRRARRGGNGGGKRRQMATMTASARTPAPRERGGGSLKPPVGGQALRREQGRPPQGRGAGSVQSPRWKSSHSAVTTASAASAIHGQISSWPRWVAWTATARVGGSVSRSGGLSWEIESEKRLTLNQERRTWPAITCSTM